MKQIWTIGALVLISLTTIGCQSESERLASMAERTVRSQNDVNSTVAQTNQEMAHLNREIQNERKNLNQQFERLEQDRRDQHRERRSELAWSESFRFMAIVIAAALPLFLCAYLIWAASQRSAEQDEVNVILMQELASPTPRLIVAPNLPGIEHQQEQAETEPTTKRREKRVTRSEN